MNAVGIDVSKGKSMVAVLRPLGEVVMTPFEVAHDAVSLEGLAYKLLAMEGETRVIMEHTGRYYEVVAETLHEAGIYVSAVNPLLIKEYGNNSIRKVKTDRADALKIAKYGLDNWGELREYIPMEATRQKLKIFSRQYNLYTKTRTTLTNNLIALLDMTFPGVNTFFDSPVRADGHQKWVDFADTFWHCACICTVSENAFTERYRKWCKRKGYQFSGAKAADLYISSLGNIVMLPKNEGTKRLIKQAVSQLNAISEAAEATRAEMLNLAQTLPEYPVVMAMYGVGEKLGPQIMAELGDVRRFERRSAIVAFAGVDPKPNQSGKYEVKSVPTSKRGSPELRRALFLVMDCLIKKSPEHDAVYRFMDKKRAEGKPYLVYMTAGANKFLRIYYARVKECLSALDEGAQG